MMDDQQVVNSQPATGLFQKHKKLLIIAGAVLALAVVASLVLYNILSYHRVYIDLAEDISRAVIYYRGVDGEPTNKLTELKTDQYVSFKNGDYLLLAEGENVDPNSYQELSIYSDTTSLSVQPNFSRRYLDELLTDKSLSDPRHVSPAEIAETIGISDLSTIAKGQLIGDGSWYIGIITPKTTQQRVKVDQYKVILHNSGDGWYVAADQALVFRYDDFPDIPRQIIETANQYEI